MKADTGLTAEAYTLRDPEERAWVFSVRCSCGREINSLHLQIIYVRDKNIRKMTSSFLLGWHVLDQCSMFFVCLFVFCGFFFAIYFSLAGQVYAVFP